MMKTIENGDSKRDGTNTAYEFNRGLLKLRFFIGMTAFNRRKNNYHDHTIANQCIRIRAALKINNLLFVEENMTKPYKRSMKCRFYLSVFTYRFYHGISC